MFNLFNPYLSNPADEEISLRLLRESSERTRRSGQRRRQAMAAMMEQDDYLELERSRDETLVLKEQLFEAQKMYAHALMRETAMQRAIEQMQPGADATLLKPFIDAAYEDDPLWDQVCDKVEHETRPLPLAEVRQRRQARQARQAAKK